MISHAISTGDEELINLINRFRIVRIQHMESLSSNDKKNAEILHGALEVIASKTARRIEFLIEESRPIGGSYYNKAHRRFFRRKPKTKNLPPSEKTVKSPPQGDKHQLGA
jgi:hypothetical protein